MACYGWSRSFCSASECRSPGRGWTPSSSPWVKRKLRVHGQILTSVTSQATDRVHRTSDFGGRTPLISEAKMLTRLCSTILLALAMVMLCSVAAPAIEEHHGIFVGTVMKLDAGAKTV